MNKNALQSIFRIRWTQNLFASQASGLNSDYYKPLKV